MKRNRAVELFRAELRVFVREPAAFFFTLCFPLLLLVLLGITFGQFEAGPMLHVIDYLIPSIIGMVTGYLGFMAIPIAFAEHREIRLLRRLQATPLTLGVLFAVHSLVELVMLLLSGTLIVLLAFLAFDPVFVGNPATFALSLLVGAVSMFSLGFAVAGLVRTPRTAQAVASVIFFPMMFGSGAAIPREQFPPWLQDVTDYLPLSRVVDGLTYSWLGEPLGTFRNSLLILLVLAAAGILFAYRTFRWD